ncbi:MAG: flagellar filament capping protein FliD [Proteobacteria bacterium]|nr:flagellar filament capping protein FliD [Pseudomonadota bacterium]
MAIYTPTISSAGIGSGLNVANMVTGLMAVENLPMKMLTTKLTKTLSQISSYGALQGNLSSLQTAAQALNSSQVQAQSASSGSTGVVTATTDGTADLGSHTIQVSQLAQQQKLASSGFAATSTGVGTGVMTIEFGSVVNNEFVNNNDTTTQHVTITSANDSLTGIRDAVNASGLGVTASIVNDGSTSGNRLVFASNNSGASNTMRISVADDDGSNTNASGLSQLAYNPSVTGSVSQVQAAKDAKLTIDGISMTKSSNTVTDALPGVTLNLLAEQPLTASPVSLDVGWDMTKVTSAVSDFVKAYNSTQASITSETSYDPTGQTAAGTLNGQFLPRNIMNGVRSALTGDATLTGTIASLADLGVSLDKDGKLSLDSIKLQIALRQSPTGFKAVLSSVGGAVDTFLGNQLDPNSGTLLAVTQSLTSQQKDITKQQSTMQQQLDAIQARYTTQFSSLDTILSKVQSTSTFLTQQMTILTNSYSSTK